MSTKPVKITIDEFVIDVLTHLEKLRCLREQFAAEVERKRGPDRRQKAWVQRAAKERAISRAKRRKAVRS